MNGVTHAALNVFLSIPGLFLFDALIWHDMNSIESFCAGIVSAMLARAWMHSVGITS